MGASVNKHEVQTADSVTVPLQALGLSQGSLAPAHRLDVGTEGLVVLTKKPEFAR